MTKRTAWSGAIWVGLGILILGAAGCSSSAGNHAAATTTSERPISPPPTSARPTGVIPKGVTPKGVGASTAVAVAAKVGSSSCRPAPASYGGPAGLSDKLVAEFPEGFGGLVDTNCLTGSGRLIIDVYVVGDPARIQAYLHPDSVSPYSRYWYVTRPAQHSYHDALALKQEIDTQRAGLTEAGAAVHETGIRIAAGGPRVVVFLSPDTPAARGLLHQRFGADTMTIVNSTGVIAQPGITPVRP